MTDNPEQRLFEKIGILIKDLSLLREALTHRSFDNRAHYERMEFLGDSLLAFLSAEHFYKKDSVQEGTLSMRRAELVSRENLANVFDSLELHDIIMIDRKSFRDSIPDSIKEDIIESLMAAAYLDGGIRTARRFFRIILENTKGVSEHFFAKNALQELCMRLFNELPNFEVNPEETGFSCSVMIQGRRYGESSAGSKKECEKKAALITIRKLEKEHK